MPSNGFSYYPAIRRSGSATCRSHSATKSSVQARKAKRQRKTRSR